MRSKFILAIAAAMAIGTAAHAAEFVQNGGFETLDAGAPAGSFEFGASHTGNVVTDWTSASASAFNLLFRNADPVDADTRFSEHGQYLWSVPTTNAPTGNFVALDGDPNYNGALTQTINGLTVGQAYTLSFQWAAAQYADRTGSTTEQIQTSIGNDSFATPVVNNASESSIGWFTQTYKFTAASKSEVLSFLSVGTPAGMPPVALLDNVSVTGVPEPATWALLLVGVAGVGVAMRRRKAVAATA